MGQQQLLLIILGAIIIGIAIAVSIQLFRSHSIDEKRDLLIHEGGNLANMAIHYYKQPAQLGGGGRSFIGWTVPATMQTTATGSFVSTAYNDSAVIIGTGNEVITGTDSIKVRITVKSSGYFFTVVN